MYACGRRGGRERGVVVGGGQREERRAVDAEGERRELQRQMTSSSDQAEY